MNPNVDRLPAPGIEQASGIAELSPDSIAPLGSEQAPVTRERMRHSPLQPQVDSSAALAIGAAVPAQQYSDNSVPLVTTQSPQAQHSGAADEAFEREIVNRAKVIIEQTRYDPYLQSHELSKLKIEYQKKKYGKEFKADKD